MLSCRALILRVRTLLITTDASCYHLIMPQGPPFCRLRLENPGFISVLIDVGHFKLLFRTLKFNLQTNGGSYKLLLP